MKRAIIITVGSGIGENKEEGLKSLSKAIVTSIQNYRPDKVIFIVSRESKKETIPLITPHLEDLEYTDELLESITDMLHVFRKASHCIQTLLNEGFSNRDIMVDYTSGTKSMSVGTVLAAISFEVGKIAFTCGKREKGVVPRGTEKYTIMEPLQILIQRKLDSVIILFNAHRFDSCLKILEHIKTQISGTENRDMIDKMISLCNAYDLWDRFDHEKAADILLKTGNSPINIYENKKFFHSMKDILNTPEKRNIEEFFIVDILNNSERRAKEGRYDDAVARLYRVFELLAQWHVRKMGLCNEENLRQGNYSIDKSKLREEQVKYFRERGYLESDGIKPGLFDTYHFLARCEHSMGLEFEEDGHLHHLLSGRNSSILAHGIRSVGREIYEELLEKCIRYVEKYGDKDIAKLRQLARFPEIKQIPSVSW